MGRGGVQEGHHFPKKQQQHGKHTPQAGLPFRKIYNLQEHRKKELANEPGNLRNYEGAVQYGLRREEETVFPEPEQKQEGEIGKPKERARVEWRRF